MSLHDECFRGPLPALALALLLAAAGASAGCGDSNGSADEAYRQSVEALRERDYAAAAEAAARAVEIDPRHADALMNLGRAHSAQQNWTDAIAAYERLIELDPGEKKALNNLANVYFRQGRYDEAAVWYRKALDVDPDYLLAAFHYGWVLRQLNRLEEAERVFDHCEEIPAQDDRQRQTHVDCHFYVGTIRFRQGDYPAAAGIMEEVLRVFPGHSEARYFLGQSYMKLGRFEEAKRQLEIHREMLQALRAKTIPEPVDQ